MEEESLEKKNQFDIITNNIKEEFEYFEKVKIQDFNQSMKKFLENMIESQKDIVNEWQTYNNSFNGTSIT